MFYINVWQLGYKRKKLRNVALYVVVIVFTLLNIFACQDTSAAFIPYLKDTPSSGQTTLCSAVLCCAVLCCVVLCCSMLCYVVLDMLCCVVLCCVVLCCAMLCDV